MQSSGWKPGTALGASSIPVPAHEASAAKVRIAVKDDTLGLGASLKSKNLEHQRTGLDAFQGLLGRLNARDEKELKAVEERIENKKLAMFAQGRWGGMMFVPGGVLVQDDPRKVAPKVTETQEMGAEESSTDKEEAEVVIKRSKKGDGETPEERAKRKAEKEQKKQDRKARKEAKRLKRLQNESQPTTSGSETADLTETDTKVSRPISSSGPEMSVTAITQQRLRNGRHLLRGRNIQAKRLAFSDSKGLDQIFMRQQQQQAA